MTASQQEQFLLAASADGRDALLYLTLSRSSQSQCLSLSKVVRIGQNERVYCLEVFLGASEACNHPHLVAPSSRRSTLKRQSFRQIYIQKTFFFIRSTLNRYFPLDLYSTDIIILRSTVNRYSFHSIIYNRHPFLRFTLKKVFFLDLHSTDIIFFRSPLSRHFSKIYT